MEAKHDRAKRLWYVSLPVKLSPTGKHRREYPSKIGGHVRPPDSHPENVPVDGGRSPRKTTTIDRISPESPM